MNANEMKRVAMLKVERLHENTAPAYSDKHWSRIFSDAEQRIFLTLTNPDSNKDKKGIEGDEQRKAELAPFIKHLSIGKGITLLTDYDADFTYKNSSVFKITSKDPDSENDIFAYFIEDRIILTGGITPIVKPITHDEYNVDIDNPYKKPHADKVWRIDNGVDSAGNKLISIVTYPDSTGATVAISKYTIVYLINPQGITVDEKTPSNVKNTMFPQIVHNKIVDEAVNIITASLEPEKYQITREEKNSSG